MFYLVLAIHVLVSLFLIMVVLLQSGKSGDIASAFGGGGTQTVFGPRGSSNVLTRATTVSAIVFMITSLVLVLLTQRGGGSVLDEVPEQAPPPPAVEQPVAAPEGGPEQNETETAVDGTVAAQETPAGQ
jgi:preprotein translocase subunit SecG